MSLGGFQFSSESSFDETPTTTAEDFVSSSLQSKDDPVDPAAWFIADRQENELVTLRLFSSHFRRSSSFSGTQLLPGLERTGQSTFDKLYVALQNYISCMSHSVVGEESNSAIVLPSSVGKVAEFMTSYSKTSKEYIEMTKAVQKVISSDMGNMIGLKSARCSQQYTEFFNNQQSMILKAMWLIREAKFVPFSLRIMLTQKEKLNRVNLEPAKRIEVRLCDGCTIPLMDATAWGLLNLDLAEAVALPARAAKLCKVDPEKLWAAMKPYTFSHLGALEMQEYVMLHDQSLSKRGPIVLNGMTQKDTWNSACALIGLGAAQSVTVAPDPRGRINTHLLEASLDKCFHSKQSVFMVVIKIGSGEVAAVDPIDSVATIREKYRKKGLNFAILVDSTDASATFSVIRRDFYSDEHVVMTNRGFLQRTLEKLVANTGDEGFIQDTKSIPLSDYTIQQLKHVNRCDVVLLSFKDWGCSGCIMIFPGADVGYFNDSSHTWGSCSAGDDTGGLLPVFLSQQIIRPCSTAMGMLTREYYYQARLLYLHLLHLNRQNESYECVPLFMIRANGGEGDEIDESEIRSLFAAKPSRKDILSCAKSESMFRSIGFDLNVICFGFNPKNAKGNKLNINWNKYQKFNSDIWESLNGPGALSTGRSPFRTSLVNFSRLDHDFNLVEAFVRRIGLHSNTAPDKEIASVKCFRFETKDWQSLLDTDKDQDLEEAVVNLDKTIQFVREKRTSDF